MLNLRKRIYKKINKFYKSYNLYLKQNNLKKFEKLIVNFFFTNSYRSIIIKDKLRSIKIKIISIFFYPFKLFFKPKFISSVKYIEFMTPIFNKKYLVYFSNHPNFGHQLSELMQFFVVGEVYTNLVLIFDKKRINNHSIFKLKYDDKKNLVDNSFLKILFKFLYRVYIFLYSTQERKNNLYIYYDRKKLNICKKFHLEPFNTNNQKINDLISYIGNKKIITFNVRNNNYYENILNKSPIVKNGRDDGVRNFESSVYENIIKNNQDFFFIKTGVKDNDFYLKQLDFNNFYDLSNSNLRTNEFELNLIKNSVLSIHGDSGSLYLPKLFHVPLLNINCPHPVLNYPVGNMDFVLLQKIKINNSFLDIKHFLTLESAKNIKNPNYYNFDTLLPEELEEVFKDVIFRIQSSNFTKTSREAYFHSEIHKNLNNFLDSACDIKYLKKWVNKNFLGSGILIDKFLI